MLRKILAFLVGLSLMIPVLLVPNLAFAAKATKFIIEAPSKVTQNEAFDVTVKAVDSDGQVDTSYRGSILFSTDWIADIYPSKSSVFTEDDAGVKKFSKGIIFKKTGTNKLYVWSGDEIEGEVSIETVAGTGNEENASVDISIVTPANDTKVAGDMVTVSGNTRKNSKVLLSLNGKDVGTVVSDDNGLFTKEIADITQENNILKASVLDASNTAIGTSPEVRFTKSNEANSIYGLTIAPNSSVEVSSDITLTIDAVKWLSEVVVLLDGSHLTAKETADGKYSLSTKAPQKAGSYPITVTAKTITNQETKRENIATLVTTEKAEETPTPAPTPAFKDIKTETKDAKVMFQFEVENAPAELSTFKITCGATGAVITHEASKILKDGKYSWYVDNLLPGDYTFKIQGQKADSGLIENLVSEPIMATIGVKTCTISNVGKISVKTDVSKSTLTWEPVKDAVAYNIYQIDAQGKYSLVTKTTEPKYTIYLSQWAVKYDNFAVKAVCGENTESADYSDVSQVQTGPGMMAFFVILAGIFGAVILRRRAA